MENDIERLINEDLTSFGTSRGGKGYDWQNTRNPVQMTLVDILKSGKPDVTKSTKTMPHQLQTVTERIINSAESTMDIKVDFIEAYNNPIVKNDDQSKAVIKDIVGQINQIQEKYKELLVSLDKLKY